MSLAFKEPLVMNPANKAWAIEMQQFLNLLRTMRVKGEIALIRANIQAVLAHGQNLNWIQRAANRHLELGHVNKVSGFMQATGICSGIRNHRTLGAAICLGPV